MPPAQTELFGQGMVLPRLRPDLVISRQLYRGKTSFVIKDPIALRYYRLGPQELYLAGLLDGKRTLDEVTEQMREKFSGADLDEETVSRILGMFARMSFLQLTGDRAQVLFTHLLEERRAQNLKRVAFEWLGAIIYFKVNLFDPDLWLMRVEKRVRFLWSKPMVLALGGLFLAAVGLVLTHTEQLGSRLPEFLTLHNLFLLWICLIGVKVVHEFGHGLMCKHYGGEVHEMGAMFIILSPFLFCNATDSWMFRNKWEKIAVNLAGILVELFLASIATLVWVVTQPGLLNQLAFNVMVVCSVSTVVFNANPLMKFDGYYALADLLEIPNLRDRARNQVVGFIRQLFTGDEGAIFDEPSLWRRLVFVVYAVASYLYMWYVVCRLFRVIGYKLEPYGLADTGRMLMLLTYVGGFMIPLFAFAKQIRPLLQGGQVGVALTRALKVGAGLVVLLLLLAVWPWQRQVISSCVLDGANRVAVRATVSGFLRTIAVREGQTVNRNQLLARLENDEVQNHRADLDDQLQIADLNTQGATAENDAVTVNRLHSETTQLDAVRRKLSEEIAGLELKAPVTGTVLTPDLGLRRGTYLQEGDLFCEILPDGKINVVIPLGEEEAGLVQRGQPVEFRIYAMPGKLFRGTVTQTMFVPTRELPNAALAARFGGDVPTQMDATGIERPANTIFQAELQIDNPGNFLRLGMSGRAKIICGKTTPLRLMFSRLQSLLRLDLRL